MGQWFGKRKTEEHGNEVDRPDKDYDDYENRRTDHERWKRFDGDALLSPMLQSAKDSAFNKMCLHEENMESNTFLRLDRDHIMHGMKYQMYTPSLNEIMEEEKRKKQEEKQNIESSLNKYEIIKNTKRIEEILKALNCSKKIYSDSPYSRHILEEKSKKYIFVKSKKANCKKTINERQLYHGTKTEHLDNILRHNFDWRKVQKGKYGFGISFANNPFYASHYSTKDHCKDEDYVMILAKVLVGKICPGRDKQTVPDNTCDTTTNMDGQVLVKYDDGSFYPEFIIYFEKK